MAIISWHFLNREVDRSVSAFVASPMLRRGEFLTRRAFVSRERRGNDLNLTDFEVHGFPVDGRSGEQIEYVKDGWSEHDGDPLLQDSHATSNRPDELTCPAHRKRR